MQIEDNKPFYFIISRAYLERPTTVGPSGEELMMPVVLHFTFYSEDEYEQLFYDANT